MEFPQGALTLKAYQRAPRGIYPIHPAETAVWSGRCVPQHGEQREGQLWRACSLPRREASCAGWRRPSPSRPSPNREAFLRGRPVGVGFSRPSPCLAAWRNSKNFLLVNALTDERANFLSYRRAEASHVRMPLDSPPLMSGAPTFMVAV